MLGHATALTVRKAGGAVEVPVRWSAAARNLAESDGAGKGRESGAERQRGALMESRLLWIVLASQVVVVAGILLVLPRIMRRGLLFGVYIGETHADGDEARDITRGWYVGTIAALVAGIVAGVAVDAEFPGTPAGPVASLFGLLVLVPFVYLRAYLRARAIGVAHPVPESEALAGPDLPADPTWPALAIAVGLVCGTLAIAYAALNYDRMPERVPTHFGPSGRPDRWAPRSFWAVMALPVATLTMGVALGVVAWLTAHAKRAVRARDRGVSVAAQLRFRSAMTRFLSGVGILTTLLLMLLSIGAVRVGVGAAAGLPNVVMWPALGLLLAYSLGGSFYLMFRYGQGGARLEREAGRAPLTDGLADNSRWVLGMFYVNRDDPALLVEKRFGLGYTVNFGNPVAVGLLALLLLAILVFAALSARLGSASPTSWGVTDGTSGSP
jgi:uncharacterized membrane protein